MRNRLLACGCRPCCKRLVNKTAINSSLTLFDQFDYWAERNHHIDLEVSCSARPSGDTTSSPYWFQPVTVDTLLWCDASGQNEAGRLRLRVEHGSIIGLGYPQSLFSANGVPIAASDADQQSLATHTVSSRSDGGFGENALLFYYPPSTADVVELLIFLEFVTASGSVSQSVQLTRAYSPHAWTFRKLFVTWNAWLQNDTIYASANVVGGNGNPNFPSPDTSLAFPQHVFSQEQITEGVRHNRMATYSQPNSLIDITAFHYAKRQSSVKTPCIPSDVSPYCEGGDFANKPTAWPWKNVGDCTAWKRPNQMIGAPCSSTKTGIRLTIPLPNVSAGPMGFGNLIDGTYELTSNAPSGNGSLANSLFWFSDDSSGKSFTNENQRTFTLKAIEISAVVSCNSLTAQVKAPCNDADWQATVSFLLSVVIHDSDPLEYSVETTRVSYVFNTAGGIGFLNGDQFDFRPYGDFPANNEYNAFRPFVGPWPFFFNSSDLTVPVVSYASFLEEAPVFTMQLI